MSSPILCEATDLFIASEQNVDIYIFNNVKGAANDTLE